MTHVANAVAITLAILVGTVLTMASSKREPKQVIYASSLVSIALIVVGVAWYLWDGSGETSFTAYVLLAFVPTAIAGVVALTIVRSQSNAALRALLLAVTWYAALRLAFILALYV